MAIVCGHKGCGKKYTEEDNSDTACEFHPGGPIFHEGLKGWNCCKKRVVSFDEFLAIPGCTVGRHEPVQEAPAVSPTASKASKSTTNGSSSTSTAPSLVSKSESGVEVYTAAGGLAGVASKREAPQVVQPEIAEPEVKEEDLNDATDAQIDIGTRCKRKACSATYEGSASREEECIFHSGEAIFHEGSKGYSCCSRKVLEFEEFLKIKGCKKGMHRFTEVITGNPNVQKRVDCRHDFYQTQTTVHISFYAKKVDKEKTTVLFEDQSLKVNIQFLDGKYFLYETPLSQPINPAESKYTILSTKVEVVLRKRNGISWPAIGPLDKVVTWTTFGGQDAPQEVLAKK
ncbi:chord-domain-containing protein [Gonapodya prolifera JEL478]|uniref:Chord-domain-containing protein n=1 Tax=Gonapodya prolifera (strain JEL478) TaxID=1344416 RepID=A0A139AU05_GONPJ|nr:chord-domain-containing protein [Gonapodya prolifera JEL478]|eukprot:KXS20179.1 chord-domain-containing protein [Gonapodya prolifera JEL478]